MPVEGQKTGNQMEERDNRQLNETTEQLATKWKGRTTGNWMKWQDSWQPNGKTGQVATKWNSNGQIEEKKSEEQSAAAIRIYCFESPIVLTIRK